MVHFNPPHPLPPKKESSMNLFVQQHDFLRPFEGVLEPTTQNMQPEQESDTCTCIIMHLVHEYATLYTSKTCNLKGKFTPHHMTFRNL